MRDTWAGDVGKLTSNLQQTGTYRGKKVDEMSAALSALAGFHGTAANSDRRVEDWASSRRSPGRRSTAGDEEGGSVGPCFRRRRRRDDGTSSSAGGRRNPNSTLLQPGKPSEWRALELRSPWRSPGGWCLSALGVNPPVEAAPGVTASPYVPGGVAPREAVQVGHARGLRRTRQGRRLRGARPSIPPSNGRGQSLAGDWRPDIFPKFSPMKTPLPHPLPADDPLDDDEEKRKNNHLLRNHKRMIWTRKNLRKTTWTSQPSNLMI